MINTFGQDCMYLTGNLNNLHDIVITHYLYITSRFRTHALLLEVIITPKIRSYDLIYIGEFFSRVRDGLSINHKHESPKSNSSHLNQ